MSKRLLLRNFASVNFNDAFMENTRTVSRYIDLLTNAGFKALFGDEENKDVVMDIINEFLPEHRQVAEIEYLVTEYQGPMVDVSKECHFDFICRDKSGAVFIVEMQKYYEDAWFKRCVTYASRAYDRQNRKGEDYNVPPVYLIGLMGVPINHPDKEFWRERYVSEYTFREKSCGDLLAETIFIIFVELASFNKSSEECVTPRDRMLFLLKNIGRLMDLPQWIQNEIYRRFLVACEIAAFTEDKRIIYEKEMYDEKRKRGEIKAAINIGRAEGRTEGREDAVRRMIAAGLAVEQIAEIMDMTIEQIEALQA